jgi:hypothetical protein
MKKKIQKRQRFSNRTYPPKLCKKQDCNTEFVPTDGRQVYCNAQHRIDNNNDKRKVIDKIESDFNKTARKNERILIKISKSLTFQMTGKVHASLLEYEGYDHSIYHRNQIDKKSKREIKFCFNYGLTLTESDQHFFNIIIDDNDNLS